VIKPQKKKLGKTKAERESSQTLSSESSPSSASAAQKVKQAKQKGGSSDSLGSDSGSESESSSDSASKDAKKTKMAASSTSSSGSNSDDETSKATQKAKNSKKKVRVEASANSSSSLDAVIEEAKPAEKGKASRKHVVPDTDDAQPTKKRRTSEGGAAVITATSETVELVKPGPQSTDRIKGNGKPARKTNTPFQRVNPEKVATNIIQDNGYVAKPAPKNDYGARAHEDLIVTRGAGFRKEKNKKKRGSYKGGEITMESHSFKFT